MSKPSCMKDPKQVLVFNSYKRLVGVFNSAMSAAKTLNMHTQSIHYACTGRCIASGGLYFRHLSDQVEVTFDDLGALNLIEYDELCGVKRKVYQNNKMSRKKITKNESENYQQV